MSTTAARKTGSPRTVKQLQAVQQLEADLERHEHALVEAQRANTTARTALGGHIAGGDAEEIAECRREITASATKIREFSELIEATQDAIRFAKARARTAAAAASSGNLKKMAGDSCAEVKAVADTVTAFANALRAAMAGLESLEAQMRICGVPPDQYLLRAKLIGLAEIALHLETEGWVVPARTLHITEEVKRSGRLSLRHAADEFYTLTVRQISAALNVSRE